VDGVFLFVRHRTAAIDGIAGHVEDATQHALAHRDGDGGAGVHDAHAALEALGGGHGDGARDAVTEVLLDFQGELLRLPGYLKVDGERLVDGRDGVGGELDVNDRADDLDDFASVHDKGMKG
jgi:RNase P/RNase MRP subunit p29